MLGYAIANPAYGLTSPLLVNLLAVSRLWVARPSVMLMSPVAISAVVLVAFRCEPWMLMSAFLPVVVMMVLPALVIFEPTSCVWLYLK